MDLDHARNPLSDKGTCIDDGTAPRVFAATRSPTPFGAVVTSGRRPGSSSRSRTRPFSPTARLIGLHCSGFPSTAACTKALAGVKERGRTRPIDRSLDGNGRYSSTRRGISVGRNLDGANRNDSVLLVPTLEDNAARGWLSDIETIWLDRAYDSDATRERLAARDLITAQCGGREAA
jgi:hypothetical protein